MYKERRFFDVATEGGCCFEDPDLNLENLGVINIPFCTS
jgi:hypothetical protein